MESQTANNSSTACHCPDGGKLRNYFEELNLRNQEGRCGTSREKDDGCLGKELRENSWLILTQEYSVGPRKTEPSSLQVPSLCDCW